MPAGFFIDSSTLPRRTCLKGAKTIDRVSASVHSYVYQEGAVAFPDPLDRPSRTVITGEGGAAPSRTKHAVRTEDGRLRRLTPEELEQLNGFPRGWTRHPGVTDARRAFLMGNALVVGIVRAIGDSLAANLAREPDDS